MSSLLILILTYCLIIARVAFFSASIREANHSHLLGIHSKNGDRNRLSLSGDRVDPRRCIRCTTLIFALVALAIRDSKWRQHDYSDRCHSKCFAEKFFMFISPAFSNCKSDLEQTGFT
jgi:hypothetical protein